MNTSTAITDSGFHDVLAGAELFSMLKIEPARLVDPADVSKLKEIAEFVNSAPDALWLLRQASLKGVTTHMPPLDHLHAFVRLRNDHTALKKRIGEIESLISAYER